jgi:DNA replication protein DnaC
MLEAASIALASKREYEFEQIASQNLERQTEVRELLTAHGHPPNALDNPPECAICEDRGYVGTQPCTCLMAVYRDEQRRELSALLKIGEESFETFKLEYYPPDARKIMEGIFKYCRNYAHNFTINSENLLLTSEPGLGKTHIAGCIAKDVASLGFSIVYEPAITLCSTLEKLKFSRGFDESLDNVSERYVNCELLIIDDLGVEMYTNFTASAIFDIVNSRLLEHKPTIICTTLTYEDIYNRYPPQLASRLTGDFVKLQLFGTDIRKIRAR